jgi:hypothetical protein
VSQGGWVGVRVGGGAGGWGCGWVGIRVGGGAGCVVCGERASGARPRAGSGLSSAAAHSPRASGSDGGGAGPSLVSTRRSWPAW